MSLNNLLEDYLNKANDKKDEINSAMQNNEKFWEQRPLTESMIKYAAQDVQYLPQVYEKMRKMGIFDKEVIDNVIKEGKIYQCPTKLYHKILIDTKKCSNYAFINRNVDDQRQVKADQKIQAFIKNIQKRVVFCSLNIGVSGVIKDDESIRNIKDNMKSIGDIVKVQVLGFEKTGKIILKYGEKPINNISQYNAPRVQFNHTGYRQY